jgi:Cu+-exporting ATPase
MTRHAFAPSSCSARSAIIGYTIWDPRKVRPFEDEERDLVREGQRLLLASGLSLVAISLIVNVVSFASLVVPGIVVLSFLGIIFYVLRAKGLGVALTATFALAIVPIAGGVAKAQGIGTSVLPEIVGVLASQASSASPLIF